LIACCRGVADIVEAVHLARTLNLEVAVRGGGHNVAGRATVDDGLMLDLSLMKGIHVDPQTRTARAQGGVTWAEFNRETQLHGLATTGGVVSTTGIAGLTLGGGIGWLMGKYGLALDNLTSVELVTADGRVLRVSEDDHADLFWAVRGAGANFGVAASLEYRLHPVPDTTYEQIAAKAASAHKSPEQWILDRLFPEPSPSAPVAEPHTLLAAALDSLGFQRIEPEKAKRLSALLQVRKSRALSHDEGHELHTLMSEADALEVESLQRLAAALGR
jgi:FAD/FMN-containing dehydrogenase